MKTSKQIKFYPVKNMDDLQRKFHSSIYFYDSAVLGM